MAPPFDLLLYCHFLQARLKRPGAEQELHYVALVRLQPVELDGRDWPEVQPVDVCRIDQLPLELLVVCDCGADECGTDPLQHLVLRAPDHADEWEHELGIGERGIG